MKEKGKLIESPRETDGLKSSCGESRAETEVAFPPNAHSVPRSATLDTAGLTQVSPHMNLSPVASYWAEYHNRPAEEADLEMCHFAEHWRLREAGAPRQPSADSNWSVKELIETAEKLLEWMPIYSKGSSGNIRQTNLRAAIEKFKVEHPEPAKGGGE